MIPVLDIPNPWEQNSAWHWCCPCALGRTASARPQPEVLGNMDSTDMFPVGYSPLILEPLIEPQQSWMRERSQSYLIPAYMWKNMEPKKKGGKSHTHSSLGT